MEHTSDISARGKEPPFTGQNGEYGMRMLI